MPILTDILVVGGGPAGLSAAFSAASKGASVMLVHKDELIGRPVRTSGGSWESDMVNLGIPGHLYHRIKTLRVYSPNKECGAKFDRDPLVLMNVTEVYNHLADLARSAGARVHCGTRFLGITAMSADRIECLIGDAEGEKTVSAAFVVDASGHSRAVLSAAGKSGPPKRFGLGVEYVFENAGMDPEQVMVFLGERCAPAGYGWVFPTNKNTICVGMGVIRPDTSASPAALLDNLLGSARSRGQGLRLGRLIERRAGIIPADGAAASFVHGRIVSVGDSAGQALPLIGEGIRYSIDGGRKVGQVLAEALKHPSDYSSRLRGYQEWWDRKHRSAFSIAQSINLRLAAKRDADWDESVEGVSKIPLEITASLLRMRFSVKRAALFAVSHPVMMLSMPGVRRLFREGLRSRF